MIQLPEADYESLVAERDRLAEAIRRHRDERGDDRCWMDDRALYAALGDGVAADFRVGDKAVMLENCRRYVERRCEAGGWPSYREVEADRDRLSRVLAVRERQLRLAVAAWQQGGKGGCGIYLLCDQGGRVCDVVQKTEYAGADFLPTLPELVSLEELETAGGVSEGGGGL